MNQIVVTTGDIDRPYDVLGPVYFQVSNKGLMGGSLEKLKRYYAAEIQRMKSQGSMSGFQADWGFLYGEWSVGQNDFEAAFFIATEELKKRAQRVGGDAIIGMRQDIDMDTNGFAYFYLQMYGTAVKFREVQELTLADQYDRAEELMSEGKFAEAESAYFRLGDFRDSRKKATAAYEALRSARYATAEEMMSKQEYSTAEKIFSSLKDYRDSKEKAEAAHGEWEAQMALASARAAEGKPAGKKTWICAACGKENVYFVSTCSCGAKK